MWPLSLIQRRINVFGERISPNCWGKKIINFHLLPLLNGNGVICFLFLFISWWILSRILIFSITSLLVLVGVWRTPLRWNNPLTSQTLFTPSHTLHTWAAMLGAGSTSATNEIKPRKTALTIIPWVQLTLTGSPPLQAHYELTELGSSSSLVASEKQQKQWTQHRLCIYGTYK